MGALFISVSLGEFSRATIRVYGCHPTERQRYGILPNRENRNVVLSELIYYVLLRL